MSYKLGQSAKLIGGIAPVAQTAGAVNGVVVDRFGYFSAIAHLKVGAATGAPSAQGVALKIQTGDALDGSDMADVTGASIAAVTADLANALLSIDLNPYKRYIRAVVTTTFTTGTVPAIPVAVTFALGCPVNIPAV